MNLLLFQFKFNLYFEIKRTTDDIDVFDENNVRTWMKVDDLDSTTCNKIFSPTVHNTNYKIITTETYVPPFLRNIENGNKTFFNRIVQYVNFFFKLLLNFRFQYYRHFL